MYSVTSCLFQNEALPHFNTEKMFKYGICMYSTGQNKFIIKSAVIMQYLVPLKGFNFLNI